MQEQHPGQNLGNNISNAAGRKTMVQRLLSFAGPRTIFVVIFAAIFVSAALILTAFSASKGGISMNYLTSFAGLTGSSSIPNKCLPGQRVDPFGRCLPAQPAQQQMQLAVSIAPPSVPQGGTYTLSASYTDANGVKQPYSGLLDYQLRLCDIANPSQCQSSSGQWGSYQLVNGSVVVTLSADTSVGIYNAQFRPRGNTSWLWSNEASVTVVAATTPPVASGQKIVVAGATASRNSALATRAIDDSLNTMWNAEQTAPQWIELDLGSYYNVSALRLNVEKTPTGTANHQIFAGACPSPTTLVTTFSENLSSKQWKDVPVSASVVRYVRVLTTSSPSWVAWNEIEAYGTRAAYAGGCGGGDGGGNGSPCQIGSVSLYSGTIAVGAVTSASANVTGYTVTFSSANTSIATVSGSSVTGVANGTTSILGWYSVNGVRCDLAPATLDVVGGNAQGSVASDGTDVYVCTNNGISNQATVTVSITRGAGKVTVNGAVNFQGPTRIDAPNTWTQVVSAGNFIGLNSSPNGQASVTISLNDFYTGAVIDSKTITARINPPGACGQVGQSSLTVGTVYSACSASGNGLVTSIQATSGTASTSRVIGNGRMLLTLDPNGTASANNLGIGNTRDGDQVTFTLVEDGSNRVLAGPVTKVTQPNPACSPTGSITPGNSTIGVCANGQNGSVDLTARITSEFGVGTIVVGSGQYSGSLPTGQVSGAVGGGAPLSFTVLASGITNKTGVTFNIWSTGGAYVSGAGAVVYRDDAVACAGVPATVYSLTADAPDTTVCPASGNTAGITFGGSVSNGPVGLVLQSSDQVAVFKDGAIVKTTGFIQTAPGEYRAAMQQYVATTPGSYDVTMYFNGGLRDTRRIVVSTAAGCGTSAASTVSASPNPVNVCFGNAGATVVSATNNSANSATVTGPNGFSMTVGAGQSAQATAGQLLVGNTYTFTLNTNPSASTSVSVQRDPACNSSGTLSAQPNPIYVQSGGSGTTTVTATNTGTSTLDFSADGITYKVAPNSSRSAGPITILVGTYKVFTLSGPGFSDSLTVEALVTF